MIILKNRKGDSYCKIEGDGIVYVDVSDTSLSVSFRVIKGDKDYIEMFIKRIEASYNKITEGEFDKVFNKTFAVIENFKTNLTLTK